LAATPASNVTPVGLALAWPDLVLREVEAFLLGKRSLQVRSHGRSRPAFALLADAALNTGLMKNEGPQTCRSWP
jgi:hypothetical protein